jgi:hypothetical protein
VSYAEERKTEEGMFAGSPRARSTSKARCSAISTTQTRSPIFRTVRESMFAPLVIHVHRMNDRLAALEKEVESLRRDRNAARAQAHRPKRDALMAAQRLARAEAKLNRRGHSRRNDQNRPLFEVMLRLLALA